MSCVVEDYGYIAKRLREITATIPIEDDADAANEPDEDDFFTLGYMTDSI